MRDVAELPECPHPERVREPMLSRVVEPIDQVEHVAARGAECVRDLRVEKVAVVRPRLMSLGAPPVRRFAESSASADPELVEEDAPLWVELVVAHSP